jgi:hypothetical protein
MEIKIKNKPGKITRPYLFLSGFTPIRVWVRVQNKNFRSLNLGSLDFTGALNQNRTDDPILTMDVLCHLSYEGI